MLVEGIEIGGESVSVFLKLEFIGNRKAERIVEKLYRRFLYWGVMK
jgi:hypothetical protein